MRVRVIYFAQVREKAGKKEELIEIEKPELAEVEKKIVSMYPELKRIIKKCAFSVNQRVTRSRMTRIKEEDTVAVLPPVAGG